MLDHRVRHKAIDGHKHIGPFEFVSTIFLPESVSHFGKILPELLHILPKFVGFSFGRGGGSPPALYAYVDAHGLHGVNIFTI